MMRITEIKTSNWTWTVGILTPSKMNVISATPEANAIGFRSASAEESDGISRIVAGAIGDHAWVAGIALL